MRTARGVKTSFDRSAHLDEARSFAAEHDMDVDEALALIQKYGADRATLDEIVEQMYR